MATCTFMTLLFQIENFTIDGKKPTFSAANLVWDLRDVSSDILVKNKIYRIKKGIQADGSLIRHEQVQCFWHLQASCL